MSIPQISSNVVGPVQVPIVLSTTFGSVTRSLTLSPTLLISGDTDPHTYYLRSASATIALIHTGAVLIVGDHEAELLNTLTNAVAVATKVKEVVAALAAFLL